MKKSKLLLVLLLIFIVIITVTACDTGTGSTAQCKEHSWDSGTVIVDATCSYEGSVTYTCIMCHETKTETIPMTEHSQSDVWSYDSEFHWYDATCSCYGKYIDKALHDWDDGIVTESATCTHRGNIIYTCKTCFATRDEAIESPEHTFEDTWTWNTTSHWHAASCGCSLWNKMDNHEWNSGEVTTPATCKDTGVMTYTCTVCPATKTVTIPLKEEHVWNIEPQITPPSCTAEGYTTHVCGVCGESYKDTYTEKIPHSYKDTVTEPTCKSEGYTTHTCSVCSDSYQDSTTSKVSHKYSSVVTEPSCTAVGYTTHTCIWCSDSYKDAQKEMLPHEYEDVVTEPSCTNVGYTTHTCTECGKVVRDAYVDVLPHSYKSVVTAPTCTQRGYTTHTCENCERTYNDTYTEMIPHSYKDGFCTECNKNEYSLGLEYTLSEDKAYYTVSGIGTCEDQHLIIPSIHLGLEVRVIGASAFKDNTDIYSVTFIAGDKLLRIEDSAFSGCKYIRTMEIPKSVTYIGDYAFSGCSAMKTEIPAGITHIGSYAFERCRSLQSVFIPKTVTHLGSSAFVECTSLKAVHIEDLNQWYSFKFETYYSNPLYYAKKLYIDGIPVTSVVYPEGITEISDYAFINCDTIVSVTVPKTVTKIGREAFIKCYSLEELSFAEDSVCASIGPCSFQYCTALKGLDIPSAVTSIGSYAFECCSALLSITVGAENTVYHSDGNCLIETATKTIILGCNNSIIPSDDSVAYIAENAFLNYKSLTEIFIPANIITVGRSAFQGCSALKTITFAENSNCTSIGYWAFYGCNSLESITLPFIGTSETATGVGETHFGYIFGASTYSYHAKYVPATLKEVRILRGNVADNAFNGCAGITSLILPESTTSIGKSAFAGCTSLDSITLPFIGNTEGGMQNTHFGYIFGAADYTGNSSSVPASLKRVTITSSASIAEYSFYGCKFLTDIIIPEGVIHIGANAFSDCRVLVIYCETAEIPLGWENGWNSSLRPVVLDSKNNVIADDGYLYVISDGIHYGIKDGAARVVMNPTYFTELNIPESITYNGTSYPVTSIISGAFSDSVALTAVTIPKSVTSIGASAFENCNSLTAVNTRNLADWCGIDFGNATANPTYYAHGLYVDGNIITSLDVPEEITRIGNYAFFNCDAITNVKINSSICFVGLSAFEGCAAIESITISFIGEAPDGSGNSLFGYIFGARDYESNASSVPAGLKTVVISGGSAIGDYAFFGCSQISSIAMPEGISAIGKFAFKDCCAITEITIPTTVKNVGESAFEGCNAINAVYSNSLSAWCSTDFANATANPIYHTDKMYFEGKSINNLHIPSDVTHIGSYAFCGYDGILTLHIDNTVTSIGFAAFLGCTKLSRITVPFVGSGISSTANTHFGYIFGAASYEDNSTFVPTLLSTVTVTGGTSIGDYAFYGCSHISTVTVSKSVSTMGASAFAGCTHISYLSIPFIGALPNGTENMHFGYIFGATGYEAHATVIPSTLTTLKISGNTIIADYALAHCSSITEIEFSAGLESVGMWSFYKCSSLEKISVDRSNQKYHSVDNCLIETATKTLVLGCKSSVIPSDGSVTVIGAYAFSGATALTTITVPESVNLICKYAFYGCSSLEAVILMAQGYWYVTTSYTKVLEHDGIFRSTSDMPSVNAYAFTTTHEDYYWYRKPPETDTETA